jgi:hypothetical protein
MFTNGSGSLIDFVEPLIVTCENNKFGKNKNSKNKRFIVIKLVPQ